MIAPAAATYVVAVLWLFDGNLPGGKTLISRETFTSMDDCVKAIPRYEQKVQADFDSRGVVVCVQEKE